MNYVSRPCEGSYMRVNLSVGEECARRTRCPRCQRSLNVRPSRRPYTTFSMRFDPSGNPTASLPKHNTINPKG